MTNPPTHPVNLPELVYVVAKLLARARGQTLEELVAATLAKEIRFARAELDRFTVQELASEELGRLVERFRKEEG